MQPYVMWIIAGFALVTVEMATGTFYLLVFGIGAFAGALAAFFGAPFIAQVASAGVVASLGAWWVQRWHAGQAKTPEHSNAIDVGHGATFVRLLDAASGRVRVSYRGAEWDARLADGEDPAALSPGARLYIQAQDGSTLLVGSAQPTAGAP